MATDEERAEGRRRDREFAAEAVKRLQTTEGWQAWLSLRGRFHRYSLANQLLIAQQKPDATRVAGFRAWLKLGYCVRKGERALRVWAPCPPTRRQLQAWQDSGGDPADKPRTHFKLVPVFDRSQVDPLPPPATPVPLDPPIASVKGDTLAHMLDPLIAFAASIGSVVKFETLALDRGGYYELATRRIAINSALSPNGQVRAGVHETAHALVRVDRQDDDPELSYAEEELVVESVAYTVCGAIGLDTADASIPYLASWAEAAELETIERYAKLIDRLARRLEAALLHDEQTRPSANAAATLEAA